MGHVLNLAGKDELKSLGEIMIENWVNEGNADSESDFLSDSEGNCDESGCESSSPEGSIGRLRKIIKTIRVSPQKRKVFEQTAQLHGQSSTELCST